MPSPRFPTFVALLVACASTCWAIAQEQPQIVRDAAGLREALEGAGPGTTILLAPGRYRGGIRAAGLAGEPERPIRIAAQDPENPPVLSGGGSAIHLVSPRHVELQDLVISGAEANGLNIDDGGNPDTPAEHVVLRNLQVRDVGPRGNRDGIKLSGLYDFRLEGCVVERWGDAGSAVDMVGCHRGRVVDCQFREARGEAANAVQTKGGSREITVARCRFDNAGGRAVNIGGSTGLPYFRPSMQGFEAQDITVEDCFFVGSGAPIAFVGVDRATVRHNTFYRPTRWVLRILQESQGPDFVPCRRGHFTHNIIAYRSDEIRSIANIGEGTDPRTFHFAENVWYCLDRPDLSPRAASGLPVREVGGTYGVHPRFRDADGGDFRLQPDSPVRHAGVRP
jgi:hypothetical protein